MGNAAGSSKVPIMDALEEHFFSEPYFLKDSINVLLNPGDLPHDLREGIRPT